VDHDPRLVALLFDAHDERPDASVQPQADEESRPRQAEPLPGPSPGNGDGSGRELVHGAILQ
jgi:hypothetical protein